MNHTAVIDGHRYTFIESLAALGTEGETVICQSEGGTRVACPREIWEAHTENKVPSLEEAKVTNKSSPDDKITLFRSLFCGHSDIYARRWYNLNTGQSGYSPACKNEWVWGVCNKKAASCGCCPNRDLLPLTE